MSRFQSNELVFNVSNRIQTSYFQWKGTCKYLQIMINNRQLSIFFLNSSFLRKKFACQTSEVGEGGASSGCGAPRPRRRRGCAPLGGVQEAQGHRAQRRDVPHGATEQLGHAKKPRGKHADWQIVNKQKKM